MAENCGIYKIENTLNAGLSRTQKGKIVSEETRLKMSLARKEYWNRRKGDIR
jgi:hypothetical protein